MRLTTALVSIASAVILAVTTTVVAEPAVSGYLLFNPNDGPAKLKALADNAANIPINRIFLSFARPGMVYVPGSNTLEHVGLNYINSGDYGFADLKAQVAKLQAGGVEVFLSVGGWNYGCFPYLYAYYSVGGYGTTTPNYYKILQNGGSLAGCTEANMWCYTCEPKWQNTVLGDFDIFPEPSHSPTWQEAQAYVVSKAGGQPPVFHPEMSPGSLWTDPKNNKVNLVPGSDLYIKQKRDPYQDLVYLAKDLGLVGVDIDYEEMWHADYYKVGPSTGPWTNHQTVYKYAAIMRDVQINIQAIKPSIKLGTAASAAGGLSSNWWGGNLKNIWYLFYKWYPDVYNYIAAGANSGGVNVMTYDLSNNQQYHECPEPGICSLSQQVNYYMQSYALNNMTATVGYEIGIPAYPDKDHDPTHQLPLVQTELSGILAAQGTKGGFFWELYKPPGAAGNVDATSTAQQICKAALGANAARCAGVIPQVGGVIPTSTTTSPGGPITPGPCSVPAWSASATYTTGSKVSYNGRIYTAQWWSQNNIPTAGAPWTDNGACSTSGSTTTTTTTSALPEPTGTCSGISAWATATPYSGGAKVNYRGYIYTAQWWTQGDTPGTGSVWVQGAACISAPQRRRLYN